MSHAQQQQPNVLPLVPQVERIVTQAAQELPDEARETVIGTGRQIAAVTLEVVQHNYVLLSPPAFTKWMADQIPLLRAKPT